jgi:hypothetical protein
MGGFNIPLAVQPAPQNPGPIDMANGALSVQHLINAVQLQKQQQAQNALQAQSDQIKVQEQQQQQQDMNTIRELSPKYATKTADGSGGFDYEGLNNELHQRGVNPATINQLRAENFQMQTAAAKLGSEKLSLLQNQNKQTYETLEGVKSVTDPEQRKVAYKQGINKLSLANIDTSHLPQDVPDDKTLEAYEAQLGMHGQLISDAKTQAETSEKNAEAAAKDWTKFENMGVMVNTKTGETRTITGGVMPPGQLEGKYGATEQKKNLGQPLTADENAFLKSYEKYKTLVPVAQIGIQQRLLSPEAQQQLGQQFAETGQLPQGMRSPAMSAQIMNAGAGQQPGGNLAANKMQYQADAASLKNIQKTFDNVTAFENTAGKNLDVFLDQAKKAIDTGLPITNLPARMVAGKLGSENQAAFDAARTTALTEIAKVLSSANAGSGVLSDSARHEVEGLIKGDATLGQIISAANILKQDMANRHQAYSDQITAIKQRSSGHGQAESFQLPAGAKTATGPNGHKIAVVDGKWVDAQTGKPI